MHKLKCTLPALLLFATVTASANQMLPLIGQNTVYNAAAHTTQETRTIVSEDFSRFKAGSESTPDETNVADLRTGEIASSLTSTPGWTGAAIYQAGGACAILLGNYYGENGAYEDTGFLRTPLGDYAGSLTVTFRARLLENGAEPDVMAVIINSTIGRLEARTVNVTDSWQDYELHFTEGLFKGCLIEMSMLKAKVLVDDIKVTSVQTSIPAPEVLPADGFTADGFTARWLPTAEAERYVLTLKKCDTEGATTVVDFDDLNLVDDNKHIDPNDTNLPEGWTFNYGNGVSRHVSPKGLDGTYGMVFSATGDGFSTPLYERPIRDFSFYAAHPSGVACFSNIRFSCFTGESWVPIGNIDVERIAAGGEMIDLSKSLPEGTLQIQMAYNKNTTNDAGKDVSIVIDHIKVMTEPETTPVKTGLEYSSTDAVITGLDPETDYAYSVRAVNALFSSAESADMVAAGLASPRIAAPSGVTADGYTANWTPSPKAEGYMVTNYRVFTAPADCESVILHEDFEKVTQGTFTSPVGLYNVYRPTSLDAYTTTPGWLGLSTYLVKGMLGTRSYFTAQGAIQTPALDLSADGGRFTVRMSIVGDTDAVGDSIVVQAGATKFKRALISKHTEPIAIVLNFDCGEKGMPLLIYSYGGKPFYIDEISVVQQLKKGQQTFTETETKAVRGNESENVSFEGLTPAGDNENFAYRVFAYRDFYGTRIYSLSDAAVHVGTSASVTDAITDATAVSVDGLALTLNIDIPQTVAIYGIGGTLVYAEALDGGVHTIKLPCAGVYMVTSSAGLSVKIAATKK